MSEENKTFELKDEELNKVSGGDGYIDEYGQMHCDEWVAVGDSRQYQGRHDCWCCTKMIRPEGPCSLGNPWFKI